MGYLNPLSLCVSGTCTHLHTQFMPNYTGNECLSHHVQELAHVDNPVMVMTVSILMVFVFESIVRVFGFRWALLNGSRILDFADVIVVVISVVVYACMLLTNGDVIGKFSVFARVMRFLRIIKFARRLRKWVGYNKRRYKKDGFDLDLTYITPSTIAMSLPALGSEANFRNPMDDVVRFFNTYHREQFLIFNLCAERSYDPEFFGGRVEHILVEDHNPPFFESLVQFITCAERFINESLHNVIAVHCKGGKGRTGVFVCAWLRYSGFHDSSQGAMSYFAERRTGEHARVEQGVSGAAQRRYGVCVCVCCVCVRV